MLPLLVCVKVGLETVRLVPLGMLMFPSLTRFTPIVAIFKPVFMLIVPLLVKTPEPDCSEKLVVAEVLLKLIVAPAGLLRAAPV